MFYGGLFWILLIIGVVWLIIWLTKSNTFVGETPMRILERRYAKGEITKKQFEDMKKELNK